MPGLNGSVNSPAIEHLVVLPEKLRNTTLQNLRRELAKIPNVKFDGDSFFKFDGSKTLFSCRRGSVEFFGPVLESPTYRERWGSCLFTLSTTSLDHFEKKIGDVVSKTDAIIARYPDSSNNNSQIYKLSHTLFSEITDRAKKEISLAPKEVDENFFGKHGRDRYPGEPETGYSFALFSDSEKDPLVINSVLLKNDHGENLLSFCCNMNKSQTLNKFDIFGGLVFPLNNGQTFEYLAKMTKSEFVSRARAIMGLNQMSFQSAMTVDQYFDNPLPIPVLKKLAERLKNNRSDEFVTKEGKLYFKPTGKGFVVAAIDRTEESAKIFGGQILMETKKIQNRQTRTPDMGER